MKKVRKQAGKKPDLFGEKSKAKHKIAFKGQKGQKDDRPEAAKHIEGDIAGKLTILSPKHRYN